jgi:hypothetical protein
VILVVDGADAGKLQEARAAIHKTLKDPELTPDCVALLVNKMDLPEAPTDISAIHNSIFDSELDLKVPHASFATSIMDPESLHTALTQFAAMLEKGAKQPPSLTSRVFNKISGLFTWAPVAAASSAEAPLSSSTDALSRIPSDEALQDNTTFLRAFEQCVLVRQNLISSSRGYFDLNAIALSINYSQYISGPIDPISKWRGCICGCTGLISKRLRRLLSPESNAITWNIQDISLCKQDSILQ